VFEPLLLEQPREKRLRQILRGVGVNIGKRDYLGPMPS